MMTFASPLWLLALPLPYFLWLVVARRREIAGVISSGTIQAQPAIVHSQADVLAGLAADDTGKDRKQRVPWLWLFGCMLLLTAMGRPQWLDFSSPAAHQGHNIMLAVDVSGSMRALDFVVDGVPTSRLDMLKQVTRKFLDRRTHDRIGLIMFADDALTFMPMTTDITMVSSLLDEIRHGVAGEKTALGDTIALAVQRLHDASSISTNNTSPVLILLTDGANTTGSVSPASAILLAKQQGVRIYTIGIGTDNTVAFPRGPVEEPVYTALPLDEDLLRNIASQTGGRYFHAGNTTELEQIYTDIDMLEPAVIEDPSLAERQEWYWLPLLAGLVLLLLNERRVMRGGQHGMFT